MREIKDFKERFGVDPKFKISTPSRVNLIGEHSDFYEAFVLPMAISNVSMTAYVSPREDNIIRMFSESLKSDEKPYYELTTMSDRVKDQWVQYVQGAIAMYAEEFTRRALRGFDIVIESTIPIGSGLSSSSVLTMTSLAALGLSNQFTNGAQEYPAQVAIELIDEKGSSKESHELLSKLCMMGCWSEYWYGTRGGAMDHFATTASKKGHAILLDNRSYDYKYVPIPDELSIIICNTMVRHNQLFNEFDARKKEAMRGFKKLEERYPELRNIRDVSEAQLESLRAEFEDKEYSRIKHVVNEKRRVMEFIDSLNEKNFARLGAIINEAFDSLRYDYEVSCEELDIMQEAAVDSPGCYGARITGGGFGGCIVAFVTHDKKEDFIKSVKEKYDNNLMIKNLGLQSEVWEARSGDGMKIDEINIID